MNETSIKKLEWSLLVSNISSFCQTEEACNRCLDIQPNLDADAIAERWRIVAPLRSLYGMGYSIPIGAIEPVAAALQSARLQGVLDGESLRDIYQLLDSTKRVATFSRDFQEKCPPLIAICEALDPVEHLAKEIDRAVDPQGLLRDDASPKLAEIRHQKRSMQRRIEVRLKQLLKDKNMEKYLQDDFYTVRAERYVVPIKLDGRGRIPGAILDTSASGQTLYIEPLAIGNMNNELGELELSEKLEIIRIFRHLSSEVSLYADTIEENYHQLIHLDFLFSQAQFADKIEANPVELSTTPMLHLIKARHPLIEGAIANDISLGSPHKILIISGPNAGGKTIVLKTAGLLIFMAKAGLLLPCDPLSKIFLFNSIYVEMGDAQSLTQSLSTFSGHVTGLKPIVENATENDLALLDELAIGTEPLTGAALAQAVLEDLAQKNVMCFATTHYDNLKALATQDSRFRNGSMEYSLADYKPTYRLIVDMPGQSYGLEVASEVGLKLSVINRAKHLRGTSASSLDQAVSQLMKARQEAQEQKNAYTDQKIEAEHSKARWDQEVSLLKQQQQQNFNSSLKREKERLESLRSELIRTIEDLKTEKKALRKQGANEIQTSSVHKGEHKLKKLHSKLGEISTPKNIPGKTIEPGKLKKGDRVYVIKLAGEGLVTRVQQDQATIQTGSLSIKSHIKELRLLPEKKSQRPSTSITSSKKKNAPLVIQSSTNTLDLRGCQVDEALAKTWKFIDSAMLRGEYAVIIVHGHGTDALKSEIRHAIAHDCPYDISHRPGEKAEGGDGATVVTFC